MTNSESEIEKYQAELIEFLISIIPVPWEKICYYAECDKGTSSFWFGFIEKETGIVSTYEFFFKRYSSYSHDKFDVTITLLDLAEKIYYAYANMFGKDKNWKTMVLVINEKNELTIDYSYELPNGDIFDVRDSIMMKYLGSEYVDITGKYPSLE